MGLRAGRSRLMDMIAISIVMGVLVAGMVAPFLVVGAVATRQLARATQDLAAELPTEPLPQRSRLLDRHGTEVALFYDQYRIVIPLQDVAPVMVQAVLAIEDHRFFEHGALDLQGTLRALVLNQAEGEVGRAVPRSPSSW